MQSLVRSMPDIHKTLIVANIKKEDKGTYAVEELAFSTEHAPFRHHKRITKVGSQKKNEPRNDAALDAVQSRDTSASEKEKDGT